MFLNYNATLKQSVLWTDMSVIQHSQMSHNIFTSKTTHVKTQHDSNHTVKSKLAFCLHLD